MLRDHASVNTVESLHNSINIVAPGRREFFEGPGQCRRTGIKRSLDAGKPCSRQQLTRQAPCHCVDGQRPRCIQMFISPSTPTAPSTSSRTAPRWARQQDRSPRIVADELDADWRA